MKLKKVIIKIITIIIMLIIFSNSILGTVIAAPEENETNTTENSEDSEETDDSEEEKQVIDVSQMVEIKGDAQNGYYITFKEDLDDKLKQIYEDNKITYRNIGVDNFIEIFKKFIKAEIATEYPNMGGVVESSAPISKGNEASAGGNESAGASSSTSTPSGGVKIEAGSFVWPQNYTFPFNITGGEDFGERHIGSYASTDHDGIDLNQCPDGAPVVAAGKGTVTHSGCGGGMGDGYGYHVVIDHGNGIETFYGHMQPNLAVSEGQTVEAGTVVGYQGGTGVGGEVRYGSHLHFGCHINGQRTDPFQLYQDQLDVVLPNPSIDDSTSGTISLKAGTNASSFVVAPSGGAASGGTVKNNSSSGTSEASQAEAKITIKPNKNINGDENNFQGSVKIRRLTPTKSIGAYEGGESEEEANKKYGEIEGIPGMGTKAELTEEQKNMLMQGSLKGASVASFDELVYLTIPYIPFNSNGENTKEGHMIVNKSLAEDVLNIFYELYLANYPIASMEVAESFLENTKVENSTVKDKEDLKTTQNRDELGEISADNNNTVALYYDKYETSSHMLGNAIDLNPQINPKTIDSSRRTETFNAQTYVNRDQKETWGEEAQKAFIDKDSIPYKIFTKYGWTWGGEGGSSADYGHFQKTSSTESNAKEEPIDSVYCDLSYVDEQTFNSYVATGDKRALYVFTLNSSRDLITASWSYDSERGFTVTKSSPIGYRKALGKYTMPIEYLNIMLVHSKSINFIENLAALGANSEYVITIKDTVEVTQVTRQISTNETIFRENGDVYSEDSTPIKTITVTLEQASQTPEVTYVNNWYVIYIANLSGISEDLLKYDANLGTGGQNVKVKGTKTEKNDQTTNATLEEQEYEIDLDSLTNQITPQDHGGSNGEIKYDSTTGNLTEAKKEEGKKVDITTEVTTTGTITYKYNSENTGKVIKHYERFEEIYKAAGQTARNNLYLPWVTSSLEKNQKTANLVEVTQYLLSSIETNYYEPLTGKNFSEDFAPDDFGTVSGNNASGTLNITGGSAEEKVINALRSKGYSDVAIAAVMGNIYGESGFNPGIIEQGSGIGFGLCQWSFERRTQLENFAASRGKQPSDIDIQIEFLIAELDPAGGADGFASYQFSGHEGERQTWMTSTDIATATTAFCAGFERPSIPRNEERINKATEYYNTIHK